MFGVARTRFPLVAVLAVVAASLCLPAAPAQARYWSGKAIWGPVTRNGVSQFPIYHQLGVGIYQSTLNWFDIAPTRPANPTDPADPAYHWPAEIDSAISQGRPLHIQVALQITGSPPWANGGHTREWAPDPRDFAAFAQAAARRYPTVHLWMIWGEPDRATNFQPFTPERRNRPLDAAQAQAPRLYARMLDAAYGAIKSVSRRDLVIGGMTFVTGDISPLNWILNMKLPDGRPPRMDLYGHNPFTNRLPNVHDRPLPAHFIDMGSLRLLERWIDRYLTRGRARIKLFLSEFFIPTDHPNNEFNFYVSRAVQARWLAAAMRIARADPRVYALGWFSLYDDPPAPTHDEVNRGLITYDGVRKPSFAVFRDG